MDMAGYSRTQGNTSTYSYRLYSPSLTPSSLLCVVLGTSHWRVPLLCRYADPYFKLSGEKEKQYWKPTLCGSPQQATGELTAYVPSNRGVLLSSVSFFNSPVATWGVGGNSMSLIPGDRMNPAVDEVKRFLSGCSMQGFVPSSKGKDIELGVVPSSSSDPSPPPGTLMNSLRKLRYVFFQFSVLTSCMEADFGLTFWDQHGRLFFCNCALILASRSLNYSRLSPCLLVRCWLVCLVLSGQVDPLANLSKEDKEMAHTRKTQDLTGLAVLILK